MLGLYIGVPILSFLGVPLIISWSLGLWLPIILLLGGVVLMQRINTPNLIFNQKFRLSRLNRGDWIAIGIAFVGVQVLEVSLSGTGAFFAQFYLFSTPEMMPELFDPNLDIEATLSTFFGVPVKGNWWLVVFWLGWLVVNIGGEELLWRG